LAYLPFQGEAIAKAELHKIPLLGWAMDAYGVIWVHRGQPDRRALRVALQALKEGRIVGIAPEGRESLTGALEAGTGGAAYIAVKASVPLLPITFTGTENKRVYRNMIRFRRTEITMRIGELFMLEDFGNWKEDVGRGTEKIMYTLAQQLPFEYRGPYQAANTTEME
jgi:1-acyl-sn-glycerol-3-phosphate acyltransferase